MGLINILIFMEQKLISNIRTIIITVHLLPMSKVINYKEASIRIDVIDNSKEINLDLDPEDEIRLFIFRFREEV